MKSLKKSTCAFALLSAVSLPVMANSIDVRVIGNITPSSCTPTLSGGGTIDYGNIAPSSLSATDFTVLPERQIDFTITCDAPAKVKIRAINGRPSTLAGATEQATTAGPSPVPIFGVANMPVVGLGLDGAAKIGGYGIRIASGTVTADGIAVDSIQQNNDWGVDTWMANTTGNIYGTNISKNASWASTGTLTPVEFTTLTGKLGVQAYINKTTELDISKPIALNGLTTIELVY
ncbi:DUF1120 domain-containing protein [Pseudomonas sp. PHC1]|uniref:DUF1120 domain-containing protein n=1 Tax=Pseudomonas sp. PHC1 TaxID=3384759 RepID=UPI00396F401B